MQHPLYKIFCSDIINPIDDRRCQLIVDGAIVAKRGAVSKKGDIPKYKIIEIGKIGPILRQYSTKRSIDIIKFENQLLMPPFFDMHFHWVQDDVCLMPKASLLSWLEKYTWPSEEKFKSKTYSKKKALEFREKLLSVGTLGGGCYGSIHGHTVDHALSAFVGDFVVGNVLMTMNSPSYLIQSNKAAIKIVEELAQIYREKYVFTPRFAITTDPHVMEVCAKIAKKHRSFIQSHLSETQSEIDFVLSLYREFSKFCNVQSYTQIYKDCGVLGPKTLMGHGIHLSGAELKILKDTQTILVHCPTSNAPQSQLGLGSGLFDFKMVERAKVRWVLGSDIGGGPYLSMFDVMRSFVKQNSSTPSATYTKALYRSTLASAAALGIDNTCGNFTPGKYANFILVDAPKRRLKHKVGPESLLKSTIESVSNRMDYSKLVQETFYHGRSVFKRPRIGYTDSDLVFNCLGQ